MRYIRPFTVVTVEPLEDDLFEVTDGDKVYLVTKAELERDFEVLL